MSFLVVCGLKRKPGPPISVLCLRLLNVGCWGGDQRALACPEAHEDKQGQCVLQGPGTPGRGVFPVFPVTWVCCSLFDHLQMGDVTSWGVRATREHIDSWKGPLSPYWSFSSSGLEPRSKGKGEKSRSTFQLLTEWPGTDDLCHLPYLSRYHCETQFVIQNKKVLLKPQKTLLYSLLLLLSGVVVMRGGEKGIANSLSNVQREIMRNVSCQKPK